MTTDDTIYQQRRNDEQVHDTTFKNNSVRYIVAVNLIGVEETGIPEDNHRLAADQ
jgi:hypothetical protein